MRLRPKVRSSRSEEDSSEAEVLVYVLDNVVYLSITVPSPRCANSLDTSVWVYVSVLKKWAKRRSLGKLCLTKHFTGYIQTLFTTNGLSTNWGLHFWAMNLQASLWLSDTILPVALIWFLTYKNAKESYLGVLCTIHEVITEFPNMMETSRTHVIIGPDAPSLLTRNILRKQKQLRIYRS